MFGVMALLAFVTPYLMMLGMGLLIWHLRGRSWRVWLAAAALAVLFVSQSREFFYMIGLPLPYPYEGPSLGASYREFVGALEWFRLEILLAATVALGILIVPPPAARPWRVLAFVVLGGLVLASLLTWSFMGLRFN